MVDTPAAEASSPSFPYADFTPVKSKKNRKNRKIKSRPSALHSLQHNREELRKEPANDSIDPSDRGIGGKSDSGRGVGSKDSSPGSWFSQCSQTISRVWNGHLDSLPAPEGGGGGGGASRPGVLCLGLGSPSNSQNANIQLAFLLELCQNLEMDPGRIAVYDPVFTEEDLELFKELRISVLTENKNGDYPLTVPTLSFMLHCDMELYESVLKANWTREQLSNMVLIGNSLNEYVDSQPARKLQMVPQLVQIALHLECIPLSASRQWPTAFNNTCIQYFVSHEDDIFSKGESEASSARSEDVDQDPR